MADTLRVVLVDDEALVRSGLRLLLSNAPDIEVVAEASNGRDAVATVLDTQPDVVLMDIRMPVMDGITFLRKIMSERPTPVVMVSSLTEEGALATFEALALGDGFAWGEDATFEKLLDLRELAMSRQLGCHVHRLPPRELKRCWT